jgi:ATP synthase protein I
VAKSTRPGETGSAGPGEADRSAARADDLDRRRRDLEAALASRRPERAAGDEGAKTRGMAGFGNALRLSSEFIAGILVGAGLGWMIDYAAGTSPWGLIIFLLLGFGAGVLNVLRASGTVAEFGPKRDGNSSGGSKEK